MTGAYNQGMSDSACFPTRDAGRRAFTLVELLISIAIIATLIGILLPVLIKVREHARMGRCLANNRQHAIAWILYTDEHIYFPHGETKDRDSDGNIDREEFDSIAMYWDWGGVDRFENVPDTADPAQHAQFSRHRALNPYIGSETQRVTARMEIFRCPSDDGMRFGDNVPYTLDKADNHDPFEAVEPVFDLHGNSYRSNEWIWAKIGSKQGFHQRWPDWANMTTRNRGTDVRRPSEFVLSGDGGAILAGRWDRFWRGSVRSADSHGGIARGWWHGFERCNMAFFDGSARLIEMEPGTADTSEYTFYFAPRMHRPWSFVHAINGFGMKRGG